MSPESTDWWNRAKRALKTAKLEVAEDPDRAASTAYYAAFYAVSALFSLDQVSYHKHTALKAAIHRDLVNKALFPPNLGEAYDDLFRARTVGDYGGENHVAVEDARTAIDSAGRILEAVRLLRPDAFVAD